VPAYHGGQSSSLVGDGQVPAPPDLGFRLGKLGPCRVLTEYLPHYNATRPHRSLGQLTPAQAGTRPAEPVNLAEHSIRRKQVLGGLTREYYVAA
jgi:hypothetical protein